MGQERGGVIRPRREPPLDPGEGPGWVGGWAPPSGLWVGPPIGLVGGCAPTRLVGGQVPTRLMGGQVPIRLVGGQVPIRLVGG